MTRKLILIGVLVLALGGLSAGIAIAATGGGDGKGDDTPLAGAALDKASAAALEHTGGGTVAEAEVGDDGAAYSVEVRLADGSTVEVSLDRSFAVIGQETDDDGANELPIRQ